MSDIIYKELLALAEEYKRDGCVKERYKQKIDELSQLGESAPAQTFLFIDDLISGLKTKINPEPEPTPN